MQRTMFTREGRAPRAINATRADCINALIRFGSLGEGLMRKLEVPVSIFEHFDNPVSFSDDPGIALGSAGREIPRLLSSGSEVPERLIKTLPGYGISVFEMEEPMCGFIDRRRNIFLVQPFAESSIFDSAWRLFEGSMDTALDFSATINDAGGGSRLVLCIGNVLRVVPQR
jgi:hypothetical protein